MTQCATQGCNRRAAWIPIARGNVLGNRAPRRCVECCDMVAGLRELADSPDAPVFCSPLLNEYVSRRRKGVLPSHA